MADQRDGIDVNEMKSVKLAFMTVKIKEMCKTRAFLRSVRKITGAGFLSVPPGTGSAGNRQIRVELPDLSEGDTGAVLPLSGGNIPLSWVCAPIRNGYMHLRDRNYASPEDICCFWPVILTGHCTDRRQ